MNTTGFDVRTYMRDPRALRPEDFHQETTGTVSVPALNTLTYLWAVESNMLGRLRDVLVTPTHADSRVTAFLSTWAYEQHWLTTTLGSVLEANGRIPQAPVDTAPGRLRRIWDDRARPTINALCSNVLGAEITGAHMVTGWLDTAVLTLAYRRLGEIEPVLTRLTGDIVRLKDRHLHFYIEEADSRLAGNAGARRLARMAAARWHFPGTRYTGSAPAQSIVRDLDPTPETGTPVAEADRILAALPGLSGMHPIRTALDRLQPKKSH